MKTPANLKSLLLGAIIFFNSYCLYAQCPGSGIAVTSNIFDDCQDVGIGTVVPVSKLNVQNGSFIDPAAIITEIGDGLGVSNMTGANVGVVATSNTGSGANIGTLSISTDDGGVNIGAGGIATGDSAEQNIGLVGKASGGNSSNIGVAGLLAGEGGAVVGSVNIEGGLTLSMVAALNGSVDIADDGNVVTDAYGLRIDWTNNGTIENAYGIFVGDVDADTNHYGIYQDGPDDDNILKGRVLIGTETITSGTHADFQLSVDGKVVAKEYVATLSNWADFVFSEDYDLNTLNEVEDFIKVNGHLPGVPSQTEVKENGISIGSMNATLLQKIEELTLYIIEQNKRIGQLETQVKQ